MRAAILFLGANSMYRFLPPITCVFVVMVATLLSSCARDCAGPGAAYAAPPPPGPGTDQDPLSSNTRYLRPRRNTARLPARTPTKHLPGRLHTAHLPAGNMCRLLPARVEWFTTAQAHASGSRLLSTSQSCRSCSDVNCVLWSLRREVGRCNKSSQSG